MQTRYEKVFGVNIIPFKEDKATFSCLLERAYAKIAPFSSADNASDKGFKDSLMWLSILDYFQKKGETMFFLLQTTAPLFIKVRYSISVTLKFMFFHQSLQLWCVNQING